MLVYLGGVMGINTWLLKGFFDTIPSELDESARVDGATPAQIFWGVVLPLALPILSVIAILSFVGIFNEYVLASTLLQSNENFTLPVGLQRLHRQAVLRALGAVRGGRPARGRSRSWSSSCRCSGSSSAASPRARSRDDGDGSGRAGDAARPRRITTARTHTCSSARTSSAARRPSGCGCRTGRRVDEVVLRSVVDGEPRNVKAVRDEETETDVWYRATFTIDNPSTRYRWLLSGGTAGYAWVNGLGVVAHDVPDADDFVLATDPGGPDWHLGSVAYEIFPDRFASSGVVAEAPAWAVRRDWDELPTGRGRETPHELFGGDLRGVEARLDHIEALGADLLYLTPFFPAGSTHRYDASSFEHVDPLLGGDEALASLVRAAHGRGMRVIGDLTLNHSGAGHDWFTSRAGLLLLRRGPPGRLRVLVRRQVAPEAELGLRRAARARCRRSRDIGSTSGSTAGGSTSRT